MKEIFKNEELLIVKGDEAFYYMMKEVIADMKEKLTEEKIMAYMWVEAMKMVVDILTKDKLDVLDMDDIVLRNKYDIDIH